MHTRVSVCVNVRVHACTFVSECDTGPDGKVNKQTGLV